ncbi:hypothetical protein [Plantactinospora endophytica]|uniref:Uncharacterized protein n=1 Tax=Plantactinospora endophytica TaxID=673535 RepID=A0ABQ4EF70_9ACTN|nr:hypothetical protein [Plantactinospora endophytica]GIG93373.1 hypothetical protein Pen02_83090 [Plantactinospora endophytica]
METDRRATDTEGAAPLTDEDLVLDDADAGEDWQESWTVQYSRSEELLLATAVAAATGVVGNFAYDVLKSLASHVLVGRRVRAAAAPDLLHGRRATDDERDEFDLLARLAVVRQCRRVSLPVPRLGELRVYNWSRAREGTDHWQQASVRSLRDDSLHAAVWIPEVGWERESAILVTVWQAAPEPVIEAVVVDDLD